jgi:Rieske Fe-S protein
MNRRRFLQSTALVTLGAPRAFAAVEPVRVAGLEKFAQLWDTVELQVRDRPAFVVRVPAPESEAAKRRVLHISRDVHLLGVYRECTHAGCLVQRSAVPAEVREFVCRCHGSFYAMEDGRVTAGIAPLPLEALRLQVRDGVVYALA